VTLFSKVHHRTGNDGTRGGEEVHLYFLNLGARWGWVVNDNSPPLYPQERDPVPIVCFSGGWVGLTAILDWCGKSRLHRDSFPDRPARLYYTGISTKE